MCVCTCTSCVCTCCYYETLTCNEDWLAGIVMSFSILPAYKARNVAQIIFPGERQVDLAEQSHCSICIECFINNPCFGVPHTGSGPVECHCFYWSGSGYCTGEVVLLIFHQYGWDINDFWILGSDCKCSGNKCVQTVNRHTVSFSGTSWGPVAHLGLGDTGQINENLGINSWPVLKSQVFPTFYKPWRIGILCAKAYRT